MNVTVLAKSAANLSRPAKTRSESHPTCLAATLEVMKKMKGLWFEVKKVSLYFQYTL